MAIKFDKEMLIKQRFWVMLGVAATLTLSGIMYLEAGVSSEEIINNIKKAMGQVKGIQGIKTETAIRARTKQAEEASKSESVVWSKAFAAQEPLVVWSDNVEKKFDFRHGLFANEIKISSKDPGQDKWPKDTDTLVHGLIPSDVDGTGAMILKTRNGGKTIHATPNVKIILVDEKDKKTPSFGALGRDFAGRFAAITVQHGRYFGDPLTQVERMAFGETDAETNINPYFAQVREILQQVAPLDDKGNGVLQLNGWRYKADLLPHEDPTAGDYRFISYVKTPWNQGNDFSKEAWIAQENLWIQKEIYRVIAKTNESVSEFEGQGGTERNKAYIFKNPYFHLQLVLNANSSLSITIKNLLPRRQRLDLNFSVTTTDQQGFKPEIIPISGDPLMPAGDAGKKDSAEYTFGPPKDSPRKGIYGVRQVLTWETAAVKRIDQISLGSNAGGELAHSHRTFVEGLRPFLEADKEALDFDGKGEKAPGPAIGPAIPPVRRGPGGVKPVAVQRGFKNNLGAAGANSQRLEHGLWLTRYLEVSEQSRRIPVAIALIIDQEHVDRVLLHFNNSKLRFLQTQVLLNHYPGSLQPPALPDAKTGDGPRPFAGGPGPGSPGRSGGPQPDGGGGGGSAEMETNMEIVIYGIMTLYQRYPPRPNMGPAVPAPGTTPPPVLPKTQPN